MLLTGSSVFAWMPLVSKSELKVRNLRSFQGVALHLMRRKVKCYDNIFCQAQEALSTVTNIC